MVQNGKSHWLMDPRIKTQIEFIVDEIIESRGASQEEIKAFFASWRLRNRMIHGFDEMREKQNVPGIPALEDAQTD